MVFRKFSSDNHFSDHENSRLRSNLEEKQSQGWISKILDGKKEESEITNKSHSSLLAVGETIYELQSKLFFTHYNLKYNYFI